MATTGCHDHVQGQQLLAGSASMPEVSGFQVLEVQAKFFPKARPPKLSQNQTQPANPELGLLFNQTQPANPGLGLLLIRFITPDSEGSGQVGA